MYNKLKPKALSPSLREKKRYLVYEAISADNLDSNAVKEAINSSFKELFGLNGLAKAGLSFIEFKENKGILKVSAKGLDMIRATFCFIRKINKQDVVLRSLGASGMLKKAKNKFILGGGI